MSIRGAQDHAIIGARAYFRRNPVGGVKQPLVDIGTVTAVTPSQEVEKAELEDPEGGTSRIVDSQVTKITETYELTTKNMSLENFALLMRAERPEEVTRTASEAALDHHFTPGYLTGIEDVEGERVYGLATVAGVLSGAVAGGDFSTDTVTDIDRAARTIETGSDISADLSPGDQIVVQAAGLTNLANSRTYTVASVTTTTITVVEQPAADESSISGALIYLGSGDTGTIYDQGTDWEVADLQRGLIRAIDGGAIASAGDLHVIYTPLALSGARLIKPQSTTGNIEGKLELHLDKDAFSRRTVREAEVSIAPSGWETPEKDFAGMTFTITVINDLTNPDQPAGKFFQFAGDLPAKS